MDEIVRYCKSDAAIEIVAEKDSESDKKTEAGKDPVLGAFAEPFRRDPVGKRDGSEYIAFEGHDCPEDNTEFFVR